MELIKRSVTEVPYKELYQQVFPGKEPDYPSIVYLIGDDGRYVGFISGYALDPWTFYISFCGLLPNERKKRRNIKLTFDAIQSLHKEWQGLQTLVDPSNNEMMKVALSIGFHVSGFRLDSGRNTWVELLHMRSTDNG